MSGVATDAAWALSYAVAFMAGVVVGQRWILHIYRRPGRARQSGGSRP